MVILAAILGELPCRRQQGFLIKVKSLGNIVTMVRFHQPPLRVIYCLYVRGLRLLVIEDAMVLFKETGGLRRYHKTSGKRSLKTL